MNEVKFFLSYVSVSVLMIFSFAGFNAYVDPAFVVGGGDYERRVATELLNGKMIGNLKNYNERLVQKYYVEGIDAPAQVLLFGSSRTMPLDSQGAASSSFFNHSVSGAVLQDTLGIIQLYRDRELLPEKIIVAVDPWLFNRHHGQVRWQALGGEIKAITDSFGINPDLAPNRSIETDRIQTLFSLTYLIESIRAMRGGGRESTQYYVTADAEDINGVKMPDGARVNRKERRDVSVETVAKDAVTYAKSRPVYSLGGFDALDPLIQKGLSGFVARMQEENVEVELLMVPYHPLAYELLVKGDYSIINDAEVFVRGLSQAQGVTVRGSYDPVKIGCTEGEFTDGMHPRRGCLIRSMAYVGE